MKRATIEERKRFAADVAAGRHAAQSEERTPTANMLLLARASVARRLVREGVVDGALALSFAVWPSEAITEREQLVGYGTLTGRAFGKRGNQ